MSENPVISYLQYLQEVSRKILLRSGFENVLYRKSKRQNPCYYDFESLKKSFNFGDYFLRLKAILQRDSTRGLYIGLGLFIGQLERNQKTRNVAAPLFFCSVDLDNDDEPNGEAYEIRWNSITLNYDLITLILEQEINREDEELLLPAIENFIAPEKLKLLTEIEDEFEKKIESIGYQTQLLNGEKLSSFVLAMKRDISDFNCVNMAEKKFELKDLAMWIENKESTSSNGKSQTLSFFPQRFFFVAPVPEQLATYIALRELIRQTKG